MRSIMILNPKGGCGKSTIATNLASYYATQGKNVLLSDYDPQGSSLSWIAERPDDKPLITGIAAWKEPVPRLKKDDIMIMDVPAGIHGKELNETIRRAQSVIIPVLASPFDIRAAAAFIHDFLSMAKVSRDHVKMAVVANRVRENTVVFHALERFLESLSIPFITSLRDTQNYIRAADRGLGIFELAPSSTTHDIEQWTPLIKWLNSKKSIPKK